VLNAPLHWARSVILGFIASVAAIYCYAFETVRQGRAYPATCDAL
jgi:hypothetical protein